LGQARPARMAVGIISRPPHRSVRHDPRADLRYYDTLVRTLDAPFSPCPRCSGGGRGVHRAGEDALARCLVANYPARLPAVSPPQAFAEFLALVEGAGLASFPAARAAGDDLRASRRPEPAPEFFAKALERLGVKAALAECLFLSGIPPRRPLFAAWVATLTFGGAAAPPRLRGLVPGALLIAVARRRGPGEPQGRRPRVPGRGGGLR